MGQQYSDLSEKLTTFIRDQKIFFVGTATNDSRVNISPKGMDSLRVLSPNRVIWLNLTGSGNETSAHIQNKPRMTIMFTAFEGNPMTLRLYGNAKVIHKNDSEWNDLYENFEPNVGARQIFDLDIDLVQISCGMSIPYFDFNDERDLLKNWADSRGEADIPKYWEEKNQSSIDGIETNILSKNT